MDKIEKIPKINFFVQKILLNKVIFNYLFNVETLIYNKFLNNNIRKPIFVMGMARSGTTFLTNILNQFKTVSSAEYKDMPFINIPLLWNLLSKFYYYKNKSYKRFHNDNININLTSPDSFEEIIWRNISEKKFGPNYKNFINKILFLRKGDRYLAKNNYNISRINTLKKIFPDCKILVIFRNPYETVKSLLKINNLIMEKKNFTEISDYLDLNGHNEFGNKKKFINPRNDADYENKLSNLWKQRKYEEAYILEWNEIYSNILKNFIVKKDKNVHLINFENLLNEHESNLEKLCDFIELNPHNIEKVQIFKKSTSRLNENLLYKDSVNIYKQLLNFI